MASDLNPKRTGELVRNGNWFRWPDGDGDWSIRLRWAEVDGLTECVGAEIWRGARPDPTATFDCPNPSCSEQLDFRQNAKWTAHRGARGPKAIASLRDVPLGRIIRQQRTLLEPAPGSYAFSYELERDERDDEDAKAAGWPYVEDDEPRGPGHPRLPAAHYLEVAQVYLRAEAGGDPPTFAVMEWFKLGRRGAGRALEQAEAFGFLSGSGRRGAPRQKGPNYRDAPRAFLGRDAAHARARREAERRAQPTTKRGRRDGKR